MLGGRHDGKNTERRVIGPCMFKLLKTAWNPFLTFRVCIHVAYLVSNSLWIDFKVKHSTWLLGTLARFLPKAPPTRSFSEQRELFFEITSPLLKKCSGIYMEGELWEEVTFHITAKGSCMKR